MAGSRIHPQGVKAVVTVTRSTIAPDGTFDSDKRFSHISSKKKAFFSIALSEDMRKLKIDTTVA
jgi:hypothetical protein